MFSFSLQKVDATQCYFIICEFPYPAPLGDFDSGNVFDGHGHGVLDSLAGVDHAEAALAQNGADAIGLLERLPHHRYADGTWRSLRENSSLGLDLVRA